MSGPAALSVFIVEDHAAVRAMLIRLVERDPTLVLAGAAASAEEALERLANAPPPGLALVDISLPNMNGLTLIGLLRERFPQTLILVVSGHDERLYAPMAMRAGAQGYVMKGQLIRLREAIAQVRAGRLFGEDGTGDRGQGTGDSGEPAD
jgi:DNA-binding NarL/FixJ family response regulator